MFGLIATKDLPTWKNIAGNVLKKKFIFLVQQVFEVYDVENDQQATRRTVYRRWRRLLGSQTNKTEKSAAK